MSRASSVLLVGAGGLGCSAALALAKGGVKRITLVDPDRVDLSNLHRQLLHRGSDLGRPKVESAADRLRAAFPKLELEARMEAVMASNAEALFRAHELVIDGTDGAGTKFFLSDASVLTKVPLIYGGVLRWRGQAMRIDPGGPCLRCLFDGPPSADALPTCAQAGVMGSMAGVIGALQALLALGPPAKGTSLLHVFEGDTLKARRVEVPKANDCPACSPSRRALLRLEDSEEVCAA